MFLIYLYHFLCRDTASSNLFVGLCLQSDLHLGYERNQRNEVATLVQLFGSVPRLECFETLVSRRTGKNRNQKDTEILTWPMAKRLKLFGITYLVGKIKFKLFFSGSIG